MTPPRERESLHRAAKAERATPRRIAEVREELAALEARMVERIAGLERRVDVVAAMPVDLAREIARGALTAVRTLTPGSPAPTPTGKDPE